MEQALFTCPMHPEVIQDMPGNCPKCGMNLIPLKKEADNSHSPLHHAEHTTEKQDGHVQHPAPVVNINTAQQGLAKYTCPMHPQIVQDGPGKCPLRYDFNPPKEIGNKWRA
ncbi:MAG: hypothetical protein IPP46_19460 [Bacteroidetes bacterium]|nr:hypothetical protein [Bacteroidota bacterium]